MKTDLVLVNGEVLSETEASVVYNDRGHQFGDGVYEVVPVYNGKVFCMIPHMEELCESAIKVKIPAVYMVEELVEFHEELIKAAEIDNGEIYTQITRGAGAYGLAFPEQSVPSLYMQAVPVDEELRLKRQREGVSLITEKDTRSLLYGINTLNRLPEIMARQKAYVSNAFDTLFVRDGKLTDTTESAFMLVKDDVLWTFPSKEMVHKNITWRLIKERLAVDLGLPVIEKKFDLDFAFKAEEAFVCGPRVEIMPVVKIDRRYINEGTIGATTEKLLQAFNVFKNKECPKH